MEKKTEKKTHIGLWPVLFFLAGTIWFCIHAYFVLLQLLGHDELAQYGYKINSYASAGASLTCFWMGWFSHMLARIEFNTRQQG